MKKYTKFLGLALTLVLVCQLGTAKDPEVLIDSQKTRVLMSDEYTFYGIDFSKFRLINTTKMHLGENIKNDFFPAWLREFDDKYTKKYLRQRLVVDVLNDERSRFQVEQFLKNDPSNIVSYFSTLWNADTLLSMVQDYQLERETGIGISFIIAEFNKNEEEVIGYVTFFDIETRELMFVVKALGDAVGMGMTSHWYNGLYDAWNDYFYQNFSMDKKKAIRTAKREG